MHLLILNSAYWDRSIEAIFQTLKGGPARLLSGYHFKFVKLPEDFENLKNFVDGNIPDSISIIGSLRDWENQGESLRIHLYLSELLRGYEGPRTWVMCFDLHHEISDLLTGQKSKSFQKSANFEGAKLNILEYFDILAWPYEHIKNDFDGLAIFSSSDERSAALKQIEVVLANHKFLQNTFKHRIDFLHSFKLREVSYLTRLLSKVKILHMTVQGAPYKSRQFIDSKLKVSTQSHLIKVVIRYIFQFAYKTQGLLHSNSSKDKFHKMRKVRNLRFLNQSIISAFSSFSWVDGSFLNYPVRKYIEMPLTHSIIVSPRSSTLEALGFRHMDNIVYLDLNKANSEIEKIGKISRKKKAEIRKNALELIKRNHDIEIQLSRLFEFIESYKSTVPMRGVLRDGQYCLLKDDLS